MALGKLDSYMQNNESGPCPTPHIKINSKQSKDMNVRSEIITLLEENTGGKLPDICLNNDFFGYATKTKAIKTKIN